MHLFVFILQTVNEPNMFINFRSSPSYMKMNLNIKSKLKERTYTPPSSQTSYEYLYVNNVFPRFTRVCTSVYLTLYFGGMSYRLKNTKIAKLVTTKHEKQVS